VQKFKYIENIQLTIDKNVQVKNIHDWLAHWDEQHLHSEGKESKGKKRGGGSVSSNASKKVVLLSGTPSIGKTTSARLISQMLGFETIEVTCLTHLIQFKI